MLTAMRSKRISRRNVPAVNRCKEDDHREMVLQVLADRQIDHRPYAHLGQMRRRADARQHEQRRGVEGAGRQDHFAIGLDLACGRRSP